MSRDRRVSAPLLCEPYDSTGKGGYVLYQFGWYRRIYVLSLYRGKTFLLPKQKLYFKGCFLC